MRGCIRIGRRRAVVLVALAMLVLTSCAGDAASSSTVPSSTAASTMPGESAGDVLASLTMRPDVRLATTSDDGRCRTYESQAPPFTIVANLADDLVSSGWEVTDRFDTGKLYDASASASAARGDVLLTIRAAGAGPSSASMTVCVEP